ncbi:MAG: metal ABC transporter substrate-binding protein [Eubacteriaceae bacterium]|nr:metal ABC transporter substrate-binding protein [Eubacteriaceae bacterium]
MTKITRKRIKRSAAALLCVLLCCAMCACSNTGTGSSSSGSGAKFTIVTTIFPQYDFARTIAGKNANVSMLLPPGAEIHSYEPTPVDIRTIQNSDLFIYTGGENDKWVRDIIDSMGSDAPATLELIDCVSTVKEEQVSGMQPEGASSAGAADIDEHVWTSPRNAVTITKKIAAEMERLDPKDAAVFRQNASAYEKKLRALDDSYTRTLGSAKHRTIVVGDRFPFRYLAMDYGLKYYAAFPGCSAATEPNAATIAFLTKKVKEKDIPVIFYTEMSNHKVADVIAEDTGAKEMLLHSCHNVSKTEIKEGATYLSLMKQNLQNLKKALN